MNKLVFISVLFVSAIIICTGCSNDADKPEPFVGIENLTFENYPKVDGLQTIRMAVVGACTIDNCGMWFCIEGHQMTGCLRR